MRAAPFISMAAMDLIEPLVRRLAGWWIVSVVVVLGLAAMAVPAAAQEAPGRMGACWSGIESAGFDDTAGLSSESVAAIDCVAHYGITKGTSGTTYSPGAEVTRRQMALFLVRTLAALELDLPPRPSVPFEDLAGIDAASRLAIAQLHALEVTSGRAEGVFDPAGTVTRGQMALFMHRLLRLTEARLPDLSAGSVDELAHGLDDLVGGSQGIREAVAAMLALGVMDPASPTRFDLRTKVTRGDMALFLARILELAGARPVRLEVSVGSEVVLVGGSTEATVRAVTPRGEPYPGLLIDVFAAWGVTFGGACGLDEGSHVNGGDAGTSRDCEIDRGDPRTDSAGEVRVGLAHSVQPAVGWIYAWTGVEGEEFGSNSVRVQARVRIGWHPSPDRVVVTKPIRARFGEDVIVRSQLLGRNPGGKRLVLVARQEGGTARVQLVGTTTGGGVVSFRLFGLPGPLGNRELPVDEAVLVFWDRNGNGVHDGPAEPSAQIVLTWRRY